MSFIARKLAKLFADRILKNTTGRTSSGWVWYALKSAANGDLHKRMQISSLIDRGMTTATDYDWEIMYKDIHGFKRNSIGIWFDKEAVSDAKRGLCTNATGRIFPPQHMRDAYVQPSEMGMAFAEFVKRRNTFRKQMENLQEMKGGLGRSEYWEQYHSIRREFSKPYNVQKILIEPQFQAGARGISGAGISGPEFFTAQSGKQGFSSASQILNERKSLLPNLTTNYPHNSSYVNNINHLKGRLAEFDTRLSSGSRTGGMSAHDSGMSRLSKIQLDPLIRQRTITAGNYAGGLSSPPDFSSWLEEHRSRLAALNTSLSSANLHR